MQPSINRSALAPASSHLISPGRAPSSSHSNSHAQQASSSSRLPPAPRAGGGASSRSQRLRSGAGGGGGGGDGFERGSRRGGGGGGGHGNVIGELGGGGEDGNNRSTEENVYSKLLDKEYKAKRESGCSSSFSRPGFFRSFDRRADCDRCRRFLTFYSLPPPRSDLRPLLQPARWVEKGFGCLCHRRRKRSLCDKRNRLDLRRCPRRRRSSHSWLHVESPSSRSRRLIRSSVPHLFCRSFPRFPIQFSTPFATRIPFLPPFACTDPPFVTSPSLRLLPYNRNVVTLSPEIALSSSFISASRSIQGNSSPFESLQLPPLQFLLPLSGPYTESSVSNCPASSTAALDFSSLFSFLRCVAQSFSDDARWWWRGRLSRCAGS